MTRHPRPKRPEPGIERAHQGSKGPHQQQRGPESGAMTIDSGTDGAGSVPAALLLPEQVRLLSAGLPAAVTGNLLVAAVTAWLLWGAVPADGLLAWVALLAGAQLSRLALFVAIRRAPQACESRRWRTLLRAAALLGGLAWGALPVFLFPAELPLQVFLPFVAAGITGAALAALSPDRVSVLLFSVPVLLPFIARLFLHGGDVHVAMGVLVAVYLGYLVDAARRAESSWRDMLALRAQAEQTGVALRHAQRLAHLGNWALDLDSGRLQWSAEVYSIYGREPGTFTPDLAAYYRELVHPDDIEAVRQVQQAVVESPGLSRGVDHRIIRPDGSTRWVHVEGEATADEQGRPRRIFGAVQDISERKTVELRLVEREQQARQAQEIAHVGSFDWNPVSGALQWSDEHYRLWGLVPRSVGADYALFSRGVHPEDLPRLESVLQQALISGHYDCQHRVVWPDGSVHHVRGRGEAFFDAAGRAIRMIGTVQDVTLQIENRNSLQNLLDRLQLATQVAHIGIWDYDVLADRLQWNEQMYSITGLPPQAFSGTLATWEALLHPEHRAGTVEYVARLRRLAQAGQRIDDESHLLGATYRICRADNGAVRWIRGNGRVHRDARGVPFRLSGTVLDISELVLARQEAERANRAKSEFLTSMSHELRTPMNAILGFGQLLELDLQSQPEARDHVQEILRGGRHLLALIDEVLDLARVESGRVDLAPEAVALDALCDECLRLVGPLAQRRGITVYAAPMAVAVWADRLRLRQVLVNLLSNAIKYNVDGGRVQIGKESCAEGRVRIAVHDSGPGIAEERQHELFQPFSRLGAERGSVEGTGVGLVVVRRLVELMSGQVGVASRPGAGSTFWVELPMHEGAPPGAPALAVAGPPADLSGAAGQRVLYVDDNASNLRLVTQIMARWPGVELLTAQDPQRGIELAQAQRPDLVLLDIQMAPHDGYAVLRRLKGEAALRDVPVVAVTANAMPRDVEQALAAGFEECLTKPLDVPRFVAMIERRLTRVAR